MIRTTLLMCTLALVQFGYSFDTVSISIPTTARTFLDDNPFLDTNFYGTFTYNKTSIYDSSKFHYRGSYMIDGLINSNSPYRNWKVKVTKGTSYQGHKTWNYNYQKYLNEKLSYDIFNAAGVPSVHCNFVVLGETGRNNQSLFIEYPDPDDKSWLTECFGNFTGDLYKAAWDQPASNSSVAVQYFANTNYPATQAALDSFYLCWNKKNNDSTATAKADYSSLLEFLYMVNYTPIAQFPDSLEKYFEVDKFLKFLVIANFVGHWDEFPNRGKNYWLYRNPANGKFNFIPWDMDATFKPRDDGLHNMGTTTNIYYFLGDPDHYTSFYSQHNENVDRPLFTRMMQVPKYKLAYKAEYRLALTTYLNKDILSRHIDSVATYVRTGFSSSTLSVTDIKNFINTRTTFISNLLDAYIGIKEDATRTQSSLTSFCMSRSGDRIVFNNPLRSSVSLCVFSIDGKLAVEKIIPGATTGTLSVHNNGLLIFRATDESGRISTGKISAMIR